MLVLALSLLTITRSAAEGGPSIVWSALSSGGGHAVSAHYALDFTLGQAAAGLCSSPNYRLGVGFWYALGVPQMTERLLYLPAILKR
jgi:hypothetical protein